LKIKSSTFVKSSTNHKDCPKAVQPEYAFIGRSNVGKSSLINMLTGRKKLAKTSETPGKTQLINHFLINENWFLADLPGYGYAKAPKTEKNKWSKMNENYIQNRNNLLCLFLLIDSRHKPQKIDQEFSQWLGENEIPFVFCFTKADKLNKSELKSNIETYKNHLHEIWEELPPIFISSAEKGLGKDEILEFISKTNKLFKFSN